MQILYVGTNDICRSPMTERLTRALLDDALGASAAGVGTSSAGVHAVAGEPLDETARGVLGELGGQPEGCAARRLAVEMVDEADLILTMTRGHREQVLRLAPRALNRTFTLREAAALVTRAELRHLPPVALEERGKAFADALAAARAQRPGTNRDADDVRDPSGRGVGAYERAGREIFGSLVPLLLALCGTPADRSATPALRVSEPA